MDGWRVTDGDRQWNGQVGLRRNECMRLGLSGKVTRIRDFGVLVRVWGV